MNSLMRIYVAVDRCVHAEVCLCEFPNERNTNWQYVITSASNIGEMKGAEMAVISNRHQAHHFFSFKMK